MIAAAFYGKVHVERIQRKPTLYSEQDEEKI